MVLEIVLRRMIYLKACLYSKLRTEVNQLIGKTNFMASVRGTKTKDEAQDIAL